MEPALAQFEQANAASVKVVKINIDERNSAEYQTYGKYMTATGIPYTVVLRGQTVVGNRLGGCSVAQLEALVRTSPEP